jgi:hypothetical protein
VAHELATELSRLVHNEGFLRTVSNRVAEIAIRLEQADYLLRVCCVTHREYMNFMIGDGGTNEQYELSVHHRFLLRTHAEAFYYFAHRVEHLLVRLPLARFKMGGTGTTIVRNHLLEHSESAGNTEQPEGITELRETIHDIDGIKLRDGRHPDEPRVHRDMGLFVNAEEFRVRVEQALRDALSRCDPAIISKARERMTVLTNKIENGDRSAAIAVSSLLIYAGTAPQALQWIEWMKRRRHRLAAPLYVSEAGARQIRSCNVQNLADLDAVLKQTAFGEAVLDDYLGEPRARRSVDVFAIIRLLVVAHTSATTSPNPSTSAKEWELRLAQIARLHAKVLVP